MTTNRTLWGCGGALFAAFFVFGAALVPPAAGQSTGSSQPQRVDIVSVQLRLNYLEPEEMQLREGKIYLRVINGIVDGELPIQVLNSSNQVVASAKMGRGQAMKTFPVEFAAGEYTLRVADNKKWSCRITVTKNSQ